MKTIFLWFPIAVFFGSVVIARSDAGDPTTAPARAAKRAITEINVRQLSFGRVIGVLGKPLGTRTTIDGVRAGDVKGSSPLSVSGIDGHAIKGPRYLEIRGCVLQKGVQYRLEGYESGAFGGYPGWSNPDAQAAFGFHSFFVVTKVLRPAK